ncbi:MAG: translation initiation factor IF-2, partial [Atopobiaceae bacterium]|nr:translation initiation factor IF-2 [Atopobiaceae bacterium]
LKDMKIPAKSASSTLDAAYVSIIRKKLEPILKERAEKIEAAKRAEAEAKAEAARIAAEKEEQARIEAERRREAERAEAERRRAEEEARRRAEEEARRRAEEEARRRAEEEARRRAEEEERNRIRDNAPKTTTNFTSLLDQIAQQEQVLKAQKEEAAKAREEARAAKQQQQREPRQGQQQREGAQSRGRRANTPAATPTPAPAPAPAAAQQQAAPAPEPERNDGRRRGRKGRKGEQSEDRYSRMAREAEEYNREHVLAEARQAVREANEESTGRRRKRKERRQRQAEEAAEQQRIEQAIANDQDLSQLDTVKVPQGSTVADLAELLGVAVNDIIKRMFLLGEALTVTQSMSDDQIEMVAMDLGREVKVMTKEEENSFTFYDDPDSLKSRPPVVTVMGHVDHGKTSLLDAIRHTGVAAGEAGGITQAIGASQVTINGRVITFIDTPGHETFTAMRARGAKVTDIVILIVAADDGVMPQTIESINHAKAAGVPIIVAVNKIDKAGADPTRVRQELTEYGIIPEEWGGENMFVDISARQKIGIDDLLESVLLQADVLELKANPDTFASGNVLEAKLDRGRGSVATVLVTRGTLHVGDALVAGMSFGKVRAMIDPKGNSVTEATPSYPVEILGLQSVPMAGDEFRVFQDDRDARNLADERALKARIEEQNKVRHITLENLFSTMEDAEVKELNLIIKADVMGSIEALKDSLSKMDQSEVRINVIHSAVGAINETDVTLADASNAIIIGFGVRPDSKARNDAEHKGVEIRTYDVIYKAMEDIDAA